MIYYVLSAFISYILCLWDLFILLHVIEVHAFSLLGSGPLYKYAIIHLSLLLSIWQCIWKVSKVELLWKVMLLRFFYSLLVVHMCSYTYLAVEFGGPWVFIYSALVSRPPVFQSGWIILCSHHHSMRSSCSISSPALVLLVTYLFSSILFLSFCCVCNCTSMWFQFGFPKWWSEAPFHRFIGHWVCPLL